MKISATALSFLFLAAQAGAVTLLSDPFNTPSGDYVTSWTETGNNLWGGVGVEHQSGAPTDYQVYFQTGEGSNSAGIYRDLGVTGSIGETITISFDFIGNVSSGALYSGVFTASLWDGTPGGTLLGSLTPTNPGVSVISPQSFNVVLASNTASNLFVQFNAASYGGGAFQQPRLDNVLVTAVPEPAAAFLGGLGLLGLLRRRRA
jgi:MYXO-CTERM domain-containing protein